jgi:hypothetical protein
MAGGVPVLHLDGCGMLQRGAGAWMRKAFVVLSGTGIRDLREWVPSATEPLRLVRAHMKLRRPGVRIEDERGNPVSFFQLKDAAELEAKK